MRNFTRLLCIIALVLLGVTAGCSFVSALLGFEDSQREWAGNPAEMNPRHAEESMRYNAEVDRIYH
jgi:hypothetical protein